MDLSKLAKNFGFNLRSSLDGYFIREGNGDDLMKVDHAGTIMVYSHNAQAYLAAKAISEALKPVQVCNYPRCKCIEQTSTSQPEPDCPRGLPLEGGPAQY
jgi:hypothetical protein